MISRLWNKQLASRPEVWLDPKPPQQDPVFWTRERIDKLLKDGMLIGVSISGGSPYIMMRVIEAKRYPGGSVRLTFTFGKFNTIYGVIKEGDSDWHYAIPAEDLK